MKILTFGFGSIAQRHVCNLATLHHVEECFIFLPAYSDGPKLRPHFNQPTLPLKLVQDTDGLSRCLSLLSSEDLVLIASPSYFHVEQLLLVFSLISANSYPPRVIVEKPLATSLEQLSHIAKHSSENKTSVFVISQYRAHPLYAFLVDLLSSGSLGRLRFLSVNTHESIALWHPWENFRNSYAVRSSLGGGSLLTQMHDLELLTSLLGLPKHCKSVLGDGSELGIDANEYYSLLMTEFDKSSIHSVNCHVSYFCNTPTRDYTFIFDDGVLFVDFLSSSYTLKCGSEQRSHTYPFERNDMYLSIAKHALALSPSSFSGLVPLSESLCFHSWLCHINI